MAATFLSRFFTGLCASLLLLANGVTGGELPPDDTVSPPAGSMRVAPSQLEYRGAFRLPDVEGESTWEYSGYALTYYPAGDPRGPRDGYPGSLYAVGHDHQQMISEISIPRPVVSREKQLDSLPTATTLPSPRRPMVV